MEEVVRGVSVMWADERLRPLLLGAIATAMVIGALVAAMRAWAHRRDLDDAIGHRVHPAVRFAISLLLGLGCAAVLVRGDVAWPIPVAGIALSLCFMAYFGLRVLRGQPE
ncbi:putative lysophospholipase L1 biosynthesis ABC-type transport system permease subunit [Variovorax boronicumulans]|uniref:hypothetical protein n=1 Tax=Variovorax TaxID=34072 RepID=UPI002786DC52|nr:MULTISPECIES: hypothetical protein [Variovorax]MDQ0033617.1 putative lysophospholipase L1 biosynthesis ABC-type transport system permease subunit [Variovorax boronicumulans]MDQ0606380.1 putative lysophospholipase L1 biosynthesis ABC-type transport system permease subunit [Variovorax sp. W1I1]